MEETDGLDGSSLDGALMAIELLFTESRDMTTESLWAPAGRLVLMEFDEADVITVPGIGEGEEESKVIVSGYWELVVKPQTFLKVIVCL